MLVVLEHLLELFGVLFHRSILHDYNITNIKENLSVSDSQNINFIICHCGIFIVGMRVWVNYNNYFPLVFVYNKYLCSPRVENHSLIQSNIEVICRFFDKLHSEKQWLNKSIPASPNSTVSNSWLAVEPMGMCGRQWIPGQEMWWPWRKYLTPSTTKWTPRGHTDRFPFCTNSPTKIS